MPLYEFRCTTCETQTEILCKFSEADNKTCPTCERVMDRVMPTIGFASIDYGYQMGVVLSSGERVAGHFGKTAPKKKRWL